MAIDYQARLNRLLDQSEADLVAFVPGENMVYFTGLHFHLSERPILGLYGSARAVLHHPGAGSGQAGGAPGIGSAPLRLE